MQSDRLSLAQRGRLARFVGFSLLATLTGCASGAAVEADGDEAARRGGARTLEAVAPIGTSTSAIVNGEPSDAADDAVVFLVRYDAARRGFGRCTGTLIAPSVVVTARHCVSETGPSAMDCERDGTPLSDGARAKADFAADTLYVFTGPNRPGSRPLASPNDLAAILPEARARGRAIVHDGRENLCGGDVALLVLDRAIEGVKVSGVRFDRRVEKGDRLRMVGWGATRADDTPPVRQRRSGVAVEVIGPGRGTLRGLEFTVPPGEFVTGESICAGDSGGPAFDEATGALVGIVSRGANGESRPRTAGDACVGAKNWFADIAPFESLVQRAVAQAGERVGEGGDDGTSGADDGSDDDDGAEGTPGGSARSGNKSSGGSTSASSGCAVAVQGATNASRFVSVCAIAIVLGLGTVRRLRRRSSARG
jgi:hypothetical protein